MAGKRKKTIIPVESYRATESQTVRPGTFGRFVREVMSRGTNMQDFIQLVFHRAVVQGDPFAIKVILDALEDRGLSDRLNKLSEADYKDILSHARSLVERERELSGADAVDVEFSE